MNNVYSRVNVCQIFYWILIFPVSIFHSKFFCIHIGFVLLRKIGVSYLLILRVEMIEATRLKVHYESLYLYFVFGCFIF